MFNTRTHKGIVAAISSLIALLILHASVYAGERPYIFQDDEGIAVKGYDVVAFMTRGKAVRGDEDFSFEWMKATWYFASQENLDAFKMEPGKFAPQFGGYCAYAVGNNYTYPSNPRFWTIVDGKLYLNANEQAQQLWTKDIPGFIEKGNSNWPTVLQK